MFVPISKKWSRALSLIIPIWVSFCLAGSSFSIPAASDNDFAGPVPEATVPLVSGFTAMAPTATTPAVLTPAELIISGAHRGDTFSEHKELHLPADVAPAKGDILICFDLTGSMGGELSNVKNNAINIMNAVRALIPDTRFGVVSHMDYPGYFSGCGYYDEYGSSYYGDVPYNLNSGLTDDAAAVQAAISALALGSGSDGPEDYTRVLHEAINDPGIGWRPGAKRIVLMWGDSVPHDCAYGALLGWVGTTGPDPGRDAIANNGDDLQIVPVLTDMASQEITLLSLHSGGSNELWNAYAGITGGTSYQINGDGTIPGGVNISQFVVDRIGENIAFINQLTLRACTPGYESWLSGIVPPAHLGVELSVPHDFAFDITLTVPADAVPGVHEFDVCALGDGAEYASQHVSITVADESTGECVWHDATVAPLDNSGLDGHGVAWGDFDGDGDDDLYLANNGPNKLLRNEGGGVFTTVPHGLGENSYDSRGAAWGDYDNDGDLDLYVVNWNGANVLYRNDGGVLVNVTAGDLACPLQGNNAAWADYDLDGDLDLFVTNYDGPNKLLNNDNGVFTSVASAVGFTDLSRGCAWGDYDNDRDPDLYVSVEDGPNHLFRNDRGVLVDVTVAPLDDMGKGKGVAWGDYDNDGDLDLYLVNRLTANRLFVNDGGVFTISPDMATADEGDGRACGWGDYNNDGWLDLFVTNYSGDNKLFHNQRGVSFADSTCGDLQMPITAWGMGWNDYDADGDLDLYVSNHNWQGLSSHMFRNDLITDKSWLRVELEGTTSNRAGVGAKVVVADPVTGLTQMREITAGSGYMSQQAAVAQFGLDSAGLVDLTIYWPSGVVQTVANQPVSQRIVVVEAAGTTDVRDVAKPLAYNVRNHPNPFNPMTTIEFSLPTAGAVTLRVYDVNGRLVKALLSEVAYGSGTYSVDWNGTDTAGQKVASGVYLYRYTSGSHDQTGRMVLMK